MVHGRRLVPTLLAAQLALTACGGDGGGGGDRREEGPDILQGVVGTVLFEKRPIVQGVPPEGVLGGKARVQMLPARYVRIDIVEDAGGNLRLISSTVTDEQGRYGIGGTFPDNFRVLAFAESPPSNVPSLPVCVKDAAGDDYAVASAPQPRVAEGDRVIVDVTAPVDDAQRIAGAFNIVDSVERAAALWAGATGVTPAALTVRWESGKQPGTFFDPATNEISLEGGVAGLLDSSDTDEFDDAIIGHEYLHFIMANHAHSSSPGGSHSLADDLLPNLAYEEGLADWFGAFADGTSLYQDTTGNEDGSPACIICDDLEDSRFRLVSGIGSEGSIYEIVWDLCDGPPGQPADRDGDVAEIAAGDVLQALRELDPARDFSYLLTHLEQLDVRGSVTPSVIQSLLASPVDHDITYPPVHRPDPSTGFLTGRDIFPVPVAPGDVLSGSVDGSGANEERGFDSVRYYGLEITRRQTLTITLTIDGTGSAPEDLDLLLLRIDNTIIDSSESTTPAEVVGPRVLSPGAYIIAVVPFFTSQGAPLPSSATYTLEVN